MDGVSLVYFPNMDSQQALMFFVTITAIFIIHYIYDFFRIGKDSDTISKKQWARQCNLRFIAQMNARKRKKSASKQAAH